jgi:hypothetical protein
MFRKGSPFLAPFNKAIAANKVKIGVITRKYLKHRPPSKCATEINGPVALSEFFCNFSEKLVKI